MSQLKFLQKPNKMKAGGVFPCLFLAAKQQQKRQNISLFNYVGLFFRVGELKHDLSRGSGAQPVAQQAV